MKSELQQLAHNRWTVSMIRRLKPALRDFFQSIIWLAPNQPVTKYHKRDKEVVGERQLYGMQFPAYDAFLIFIFSNLSLYSLT